jgi:secernin
MCDTLVATADVTKDNVTIFAKNSDREPNEAQLILSVPGCDHPSGSKVKCTYIEIPQASHTHALLLSKPFWIWGGEMGTNEHGVTIGNEAVFSKEPAKMEDALIGMDLLRLGLERADTAQGALHVITELLEEFGQGGNCGFHHNMYYHNSFIIADPGEAWVLETVDRHWAARKIQGICTISNGFSLGGQWDMASQDLVRYAVDKKWCKGRDDFHFSNCYSDVLFTRFSDCRHRSKRTRELLEAEAGRIDIHTAAAVLRDHAVSTAGERRPMGITGAGVCMHGGFGLVRASQTTGSMISHLHPEHQTHFFTGTAAPCTGIFKPLWTDTSLPDMGPSPTGTYDPASLFWRHERLHRALLTDYDARISLYREERDAVENDFFRKALDYANENPVERGKFSMECFAKSLELEDEWLQRVVNHSPGKIRRILHHRTWNGYDKEAGMPGIEE